MTKLKRLFLLLFLCFSFGFLQAQNISWMIGTWKGTGDIPGSTKTRFIKTIIIDSVSGENFTGTRINEVDDRSHAKIITSMFGYFNQDQLNIQNGAVLYKNGPWLDCSSCTPVNKITIVGDSLALNSRISGCQKYCDGVSVYYRSLCDYDSATQVYLIHFFGTASDIASFSPCKKKTPVLIANNKQKRATEDSIKNAIALDKKRLQQINDSLDLAKQKEQIHTKDSLETAAAFMKKRELQVQDSLNVIRKRRQQIDDSIQNAAAIAKRKEQQRIQDSLDNATAIAKQQHKQIDDSTKNAVALAKIKQQRIDDSISVAKKRQQQVEDSLQAVAAIAKQKEQQRIKDSLNNAAIIAKQRQQQIDDSTKNAVALAKLRQQQIDDSISVAKKRQQVIEDSLQTVADIAKQKEQQRIKDSLNNAAIIAKQRQQQIDDSTKNAVALAKIRQQQISDSLSAAKKRHQVIEDSLQTVAAIAKQKEQQRIKDSLTNAAIIAKQRQQRVDDSIAVAKKQQQHIQDSLINIANIAKQKQQKRIQDSLDNAAIFAKLKQKRIDDSTMNAITLAKQREQQINDSLAIVKKRQQQIADSLVTVKKQLQIKRQEDSINNAAASVTKRAVAAGTDSAKTSTVKAFETRTNVLLQSYHIATPDILVELFDNAEIDGDRVSVYHNNTLIVNNQTLTHEPITFKIHADAGNRVHEFVMIAENLGTIPPNTALLRITVGTQIYKLGVKTDLQTNAKIVFYYDGN